MRPPVDIRPLVEKIDPPGLRFDVHAVTLFRSILDRGPARYEIVNTVEL